MQYIRRGRTDDIQKSNWGNFVITADDHDRGCHCARILSCCSVVRQLPTAPVGLVRSSPLGGEVTGPFFDRALLFDVSTYGFRKSERRPE